MPAFSLVRFLTMLALLLMPLAMAEQGHAVAAAPHGAAAASAGDHRHHRSSGPQQEERKQDALAQCMMACAALPAMEAPAQAETQALRPAPFALPVLPIIGLAPEAATPPPRTA